MKPDTSEWYHRTQQSLDALRKAQPMSRELRDDLEDEAQILIELISDAEQHER